MFDHISVYEFAAAALFYPGLIVVVFIFLALTGGTEE